MPRTRTGPVRRRRHKKIIKMMKGQWGTRGRLFKRSNEAMLKSLWYAYRDRRTRKRVMRRLWVTRINAAARMNGLIYSRFIYGLKQAGRGSRPQDAGRHRSARPRHLQEDRHHQRD